MNILQKNICSVCVGLCVALISVQSLAHGRWIVPSDTILSSEEPVTITLDFSVSNDVFHPDHAYGGVALQTLFDAYQHKMGKDNKKDPKDKKPKGDKKGNKDSEAKAKSPMAKIMASTRLRSVSPSGKITEDASIVSFGRKSVAALALEESGTYRISVAQDPIHFVSFKYQDGKPGRMFGQLKEVTLPEGAKDIESVTLINRVQTFVTRNGLTHENIQPQKDGLDVSSYMHPNELFSKEKNKYTLFFNGKPLANQDVKITRGGTRYRNDRELIERTSDSNGRFEVQWPEAGMYVLEAEMSEKTEQGTISYGLFLTLEVNPE